MAKLVKYIFIPILFVFLMSHNARAVSRTIYLKNGVYSYGIPANSGSQGGSNTFVTSNDTYNYNVNAYSLAANKMFYSMAFRFKSDNTNIDLSPYTDFTFTFSYCSDTQYFAPSSNDVFRVTDYYEYQASNTEYTLYSGQTSDYTYETDHCRNVMLRGKVGISSYHIFQLGTTSNGSFTRIFGYNFGNLNGAPPLLIISPTVVFYDVPDEADKALEKERSEAQDASNQSETSGSSSQNDATNATSSLISVITSGIGAITSASASNCVIDADMGNFDMGSIDLCANPVPTFMQVIGSIIAALIVLPLVIVLFNRFIAIIGSFQR